MAHISPVNPHLAISVMRIHIATNAIPHVPDHQDNVADTGVDQVVEDVGQDGAPGNVDQSLGGAVRVRP